MPTPRPANCVTTSAVENPAEKMKSAISASVSVVSAPMRPFSIAFSRIRSMSRPAPSSDSESCTSLPSCFQLETNFADFRLGCAPALVRRLDAVHHGVAQQVLERSGDALEHRAIELDLGAFDVQIGALADFLGGLPHDAVETFLEAAEGHHAHSHQVLLQVAVQPRLREQRLLRLVHRVDEVSVHRRHVADALGHQPRHFLKAGEAVEFERVKLAHGFLGEFQARLHLRLGLDFDLAKLGAQARDVVGEFLHGGLERAHFALDPAARDGDFARLVDQAVDHVRAHPQQRLGLQLALCERHRLRRGPPVPRQGARVRAPPPSPRWPRPPAP